MFKSTLVFSALIFLIPCLFVNDCAAQMVITRLPKDGAWARYELVSKDGAPEVSENDKNDEDMVTRGEFIIRSVGTERIDTKIHRWLEFETRIKMPAMFGDMGETVTIVKVLVPEVEFSVEKPFAGKVKQMFVQDDHRNQGATEEFAPNSNRAKQLMRDFTSHVGLKTKPIEGKEIKTDIGTFHCQGTNYSGLERAGDSGESKGSDEAEGADAVKNNSTRLTFDSYSSDKSPFGLVKVTADIQDVFEGKKLPPVTAEITLKEIGTGAKSAIDHEKLSDKNPLRY